VRPGKEKGDEPATLRIAFADTSDERLAAGTGAVAAVFRDLCKGVKAQTRKTALECIVFYLLAISSFYLAESIKSNGIIGAWICGLCTKHWTLHNLSVQGQGLVDDFLLNMSAMLLNFVLLWIGITVIYLSGKCLSVVAVTGFLLSMVGRLGCVVIISTLYNLVAKSSNDIKFKDMVLLWTAGVRGPTALALVYEFPSSLREDFIGAALLSILVTNVVFGGVCVYLVKVLGIPNAAQDYPAVELRSRKDSSLCLTLLTSVDRLFLSWWLVVHKKHEKNTGKPMPERADIPRPTREDFAGARGELQEALIGRGAVEGPEGGEEGGFNVTNPMMAAAEGSLGATRRAANSRGRGGPTGPLRTPFRIPGTLSGLTKTH
jgi:hypothetical protein